MAPLPPRPLKGSRMDYCLPRRSREAVLTIIHQLRLTLRKHKHLAGTGVCTLLSCPGFPLHCSLHLASCCTSGDLQMLPVKDGSPAFVATGLRLVFTSLDSASHITPIWRPGQHVQHCDQGPSRMWAIYSING